LADSAYSPPMPNTAPYMSTLATWVILESNPKAEAVETVSVENSPKIAPTLT
jgi:hypothetical protein